MAAHRADAGGGGAGGLVAHRRATRPDRAPPGASKVLWFGLAGVPFKSVPQHLRHSQADEQQPEFLRERLDSHSVYGEHYCGPQFPLGNQEVSAAVSLHEGGANWFHLRRLSNNTCIAN